MNSSADPQRVRIVGGGLAGCEAAVQLARAGYAVELREQKPERRTPAQVTDRLAELVCSNSLRSSNVENAVGLLKEEMRRVGGFLIECADRAAVPAGDALAVDRAVFSDLVERGVREAGVRVIAGEVTSLTAPDGAVTILATGPLTSDALAHQLQIACGERLAFYDAIAPIIEADSVDLTQSFFASRWGKGEGADYLNCPLTREEYARFLAALIAADQAHAKDFEELHYFEGCLPLEVMAARGPDTLRFGPMKPVGLDDPRTGRWPYAVLQLRKEDVHGTAYNLVGCQTRMKQPDQRAVFAQIPALKDARFLRYGAIHRNTYVDAPLVLDAHNQLRARPGVYLAGQITGVEGYVESIASGLVTARVVADVLAGRTPEVPPETTALGGLWRHVRGALRADPTKYEPSNVMWSMVPPLPDETIDAIKGKRKKPGKGEKRQALVARALADLDGWLARTKRAA